MSHSPGPWKWVGDPAALIEDANGKPVFWPHNVPGEVETWSDLLGDGEGDERRSEANASLIADAWQLPQLRVQHARMLELLREFESDAREMADDNGCRVCPDLPSPGDKHSADCPITRTRVLIAEIDGKGTTPTGP